LARPSPVSAGGVSKSACGVQSPIPDFALFNVGYACQVERFRVLNGLDTKDKVKAGDLVKIVVE
jgi:predicted Zn-dependent protease